MCGKLPIRNNGLARLIRAEKKVLGRATDAACGAATVGVTLKPKRHVEPQVAILPPILFPQERRQLHQRLFVSLHVALLFVDAVLQ
jgi:hypothetical protein